MARTATPRTPIANMRKAATMTPANAVLLREKAVLNKKRIQMLRNTQRKMLPVLNSAIQTLRNANNSNINPQNRMKLAREITKLTGMKNKAFRIASGAKNMSKK